MDDFLMAARFFFNTGWAFLTSFNLPGVNFTPLQALFGASFVVVSIKFLRSVVGHLSGGGHRSGRGVSSPPKVKS